MLMDQKVYRTDQIVCQEMDEFEESEMELNEDQLNFNTEEEEEFWLSFFPLGYRALQKRGAFLYNYKVATK